MRMEHVIGIAVAIGAVALLAGVSLGTVFLGAVFLACPLMMLFMVHGASKGDAAHGEHREDDSSAVDSVGSRK